MCNNNYIWILILLLLFCNGGIVGAYFPTYLNSASMPVQIQDIIAKRFAVIRHLQPFDRILK